MPDNGTRLVSLAERPDLSAAVMPVLASRWPAFMLHGRPGHDVDLPGLLSRSPAHQVLLVDAAGEVLAVGLSTPLAWDRTADGLPTGWDGAVAASAELLDRGAAPSAVCALSITITPAGTGRGYGIRMVQALKAAAATAGVHTLIAPVRPALKDRYPLIPMPRYVTWRTADGRVFDPWLRLHLTAGATQLRIAERSMTITGTPAEWSTWTGLDLPGSGSYVIPRGLAPLAVDLDAGTGRYEEANVWVAHPIA